MHVDVVVVGGGLAGLVAANRAAELGLRVAVLEKSTEELYACNSRFSSGAIHVGMLDAKAPTADLLERIQDLSAGFARPELAHALASDIGRSIDWLQAHGARFIKAGPYVWQRWVLAPPGMNRTGLHWQGRGADVLLRTMSEELKRHGGEILLGAEAKSLITDNGLVAGVEAVMNGHPMSVHAEAVVLADGGFQADLEMLRQHITPRPDLIKLRGAATGTGAAVKMATDAGATLVGMEWFYGHLLCRDVFDNAQLWPYPWIDYIAAAAIVVDANGKRVGDEGRGGIYMANIIARMEDPASCHVIFDEAIWNGPGKDLIVPPNPNLTLAGGTLHKAQDLTTLANLIGIQPGQLQETVLVYNESLARGTAAQTAPARTTDRHRPYPILTSPFYAIPLCPAITYTMGGLLIDEFSRVLRQDGSAIPGLYAAGSTTGGLEGGPEAGYIGGLAKATVFGMRAAEQIARQVDKPA